MGEQADGPKREKVIEISKTVTAVYVRCSHPDCQWRFHCELHGEKEHQENRMNYLQPEIVIIVEEVVMMKCMTADHAPIPL